MRLRPCAFLPGSAEDAHALTIAVASCHERIRKAQAPSVFVLSRQSVLVRARARLPRGSASVSRLSDDEKTDAKTETEKEAKPDHGPPAAAETKGTWTGGASPIDYTATGKWLVLRKKEKPAAEIFSVSYVADRDDEDRPVTFVFNGGPGASSAYPHLGAVGPKRVEWPPDGSLPEMPPRLVQNEASWLAFSDLVFVDPVGTGFSRVIEKDKDKGGDEKEKKDDADYDVLGWIDRLPTMAAAAVHHGRSRAFAHGTALDEVLRDAEAFATGDYASFLTRVASMPSRSATASSPGSPTCSACRST